MSITPKGRGFSFIVLLQLLIMSGCATKTVTRYRIESVPEKSIEYHKVQKEVTKEIEVPYAEEMRIPVYATIKEPKLNSPSYPITLAFLPLSSSAGDISAGDNVTSLIEEKILSNPDAAKMYKSVNRFTIKENYSGKDLTKLHASDLRQIADGLFVDYFIAGNLINKSEDMISLTIEAIKAESLKTEFLASLSGASNDILERISELFYGKKTISGYRTETVTKYRKEQVTEKVWVDEPIEKTTMVQKKVAYTKEVLNPVATLVFAAAIGIPVLIAKLFAKR